MLLKWLLSILTGALGDALVGIVFILLLALGLLYAWRKKVLQWI